MPHNLFEELQNKKQKISALIVKAQELGWIKGEEKAEYLSKLENDVLTIGVIGQMKAGKSTFLNAFVFEDDILPAATTPMTAALSVITYGPEKKLVAEFYNQDEWQEQLMTAKMPIEDSTDELLKSKIKAAQELVEKSSKLGGSLNSLLGKTQNDTFDNLEEYVGADGKYVSITKSVTVYYPKEYLKGVNIVDTPGFNDPIVSREERTKEFLKKADVVLLMLYAGRPFDATDRGILFKNVGDCGIGKVLIGINKYDIPYENGDTEDEICNYVRNEIAKASSEMGDDQLNEILRETAPIPLSAEMALLSTLSMSKINSNDSFSHAWKRSCDTFEISSQREMRDKSHIENLIDAVRQVIEREKEAILFKKPLNAILARGNSLTAKVNDEIATTKAEIVMLERPDDELEEMESSLSRVARRINKKIDGLGDDLNFTFEDIIRRGSQQLEDAVESSCRKMNGLVDSWGRFSNAKKLQGDIEREIEALSSRTLKRICDNINRDAKHKIKSTLDEFFSSAEEILMKLPADFDFDQRDFVKSVSQQFNFTNDASLFEISDDDSTDDYGWGEGLFDFFNGFTFGALGLVTNVFSHGDVANDAKNWISKIKNTFEAEPYLEGITSGKDKIIDEVKKRFIDELLTPFQTKLDEIKQQGIDKQKRLEEARKSLENLLIRKQDIEKQVETIQAMK